MGLSDVGFSSHAAPTYYPHVQVFLVESRGLGFNAEGHLTEGRVPCKAMPEDLGVWGFSFWPSVPKGVIVHV